MNKMNTNTAAAAALETCMGSIERRAALAALRGFEARAGLPVGGLGLGELGLPQLYALVARGEAGEAARWYLYVRGAGPAAPRPGWYQP